MPGKHSDRQKRQAHHVADSEKKRGMDPKRAESVGWATVNKQKKLKKNHSLAHVQNQLSSASSVGPRGPSKPAKTPSSLAHVQNQLSSASSVVGKSKKKSKLKKDDGAVSMPAAGDSASMGKAFHVMSIDDYYDSVVKADGMPAPKPAAAPGAVPTGAPKKFPRGDKPTVKMKPVSDQEAMANLKAGKHIEKKLSARKALQTGYGKTSGGGALKAPNRGFRSARTMRDRPSDISLSVADLNRAMEAMPSPAKTGPPKVYLPGVHNPKSPVRGQMGLKRPKAGKSVHDEKRKLKKTYPTLNASMRPSVVSEKSPRAVDGGGATELSNSLKNVVHKSGGAATMSKMNFNDLFKSELGIANDDVLVDCPHCEEPITKSDLAKAKGHKGKGSATHLTGAEHGKSSAHVVDQNPAGGVMRGGDGKGVLSPSRGVPGAKKTDAVVGVQNSKGSKHTAKAMDTSSKDDDDSSDDDSSDDKAPPFEKKKSIGKSISVRGTNEVQYIDYGDAPGSDAWIAKSIAEGTLGGIGSANGQPTQPLDLNNDLTRLLI